MYYFIPHALNFWNKVGQLFRDNVSLGKKFNDRRNRFALLVATGGLAVQFCYNRFDFLPRLYKCPFRFRLNATHCFCRKGCIWIENCYPSAFCLLFYRLNFLTKIEFYIFIFRSTNSTNKPSYLIFELSNDEECGYRPSDMPDNFLNKFHFAHICFAESDIR